MATTDRNDGNRGGIALLLVDVQYDFIDGTLAVNDAMAIIPTIKELVESVPFDLIVASQDYHPPGHVSFASTHPSGPGAFQLHSLPHPIPERAQRGEHVTQMMWPDHCVQGTRGADFQAEIWSAVEAQKERGTPVYVVQKGTDCAVDGYSAFADNQYLGFTELPRLLSRGGTNGQPIETLVVVGLATDYCVMSSAIDARKFHLRTLLVADGVRGVKTDTTQAAMSEMKQWGVEVVQNVEQVRGALC